MPGRPGQTVHNCDRTEKKLRNCSGSAALMANHRVVDVRSMHGRSIPLKVRRNPELADRDVNPNRLETG